MIVLKYYYLVELNLSHPEINRLEIAREFDGQGWLTLNSKPFDDQDSCMNACIDFIEAKRQQLVKSGLSLLDVVREDNPLLEATEADLSEYEEGDLGFFDENTLCMLDLIDSYGDWLIRGSVLVFVNAPGESESIH